MRTIRNYALSFLFLAGIAQAQIPADRAQQIEAAAPDAPQVQPKAPRRVLIFNSPAHIMPDDPHKGYCIPYGAYAFETLGRKTGAYEPVVSDDLAHFLPERIGAYDAIVLNNTSRNWITPTEEQAASAPFNAHGGSVAAVEAALRASLLDYVREGGGLMAIHYAIGANTHWPEFAELLGASYNGHPWNEEVTIKLDEPEHPLVAAFNGDSFRIADEIYEFKAPYSRDNVRILLSLDTLESNMAVPWIKRDDYDFALAWVRPEGKGRVYCNALGHRTEVYWDPRILRAFLDGVQFCTGDLDAPAAPHGGGAPGPEHGFVSLFNGEDLTGWRGDPEIWSVEDGVLTGQTTSAGQLDANNFLVWEGGQPEFFELRAEFKLEGGNSGIYYHGEPQETGDHLIGPQADFSADHRWTGVLMEWRGRDVLAERGYKTDIDADGNKQTYNVFGDPAKLLEHVNGGEWNEYTVITRSERTLLRINGVTMCEVIDRDPNRNTKGHLALQVHQGPPMKVQFRNLRIREF